MAAVSSADLFLGRLERVRRSGTGWTARCPAHQDRNASLSISLGDDERILLHGLDIAREYGVADLDESGEWVVGDLSRLAL